MTRLIGLTGLVAAAALLALAARADSAVTTSVVYHAKLHGNNEILVVSAAGGAPTRLTRHRASDSNPTWSADGSLIAFESNRRGRIRERDADVYVMASDGTRVRQITFSNGISALDAFQSSAMGEGWSDWYGMDFVVEKSFETDGAGDGDVVSAFQGDRSESIDCPVGSPVAQCVGAGTAGSGGYTYGDVGKIFGSPEVHADGEIWAQTLWDLRVRLGGATARGLVTRAMALSPTNPSFLDMRHAILQADTVSGGTNRITG